MLRRRKRPKFSDEQLAQLNRESHHPECDVWDTGRWCNCKGLPFDVWDRGYAYICGRGTCSCTPQP